MANHRVASRYAKALFELAEENGDTDRVRQELADFSTLLTENQQMRDVLLQPLRTASQRKTVLEHVVDCLGAGSTLFHFYSFLIDQRRLIDFEAIQVDYERQAAAARGVIQAELFTASPLTEDQIDRLRRALSTRVGGEVSLRVKVDADLIGGVVAKVGDLLFDGSLRTQLVRMKAALLKERGGLPVMSGHADNLQEGEA